MIVFGGLSNVCVFLMFDIQIISNNFSPSVDIEVIFTPNTTLRETIKTTYQRDLPVSMKKVNYD
jgi:hypothetical protein